MEISTLRGLVFDLLSDHPPELGARLKQRLAALCLRKGLGVFNEREFGYQKFGDFLKNLDPGIIVERRPGASDIHVSIANPQFARPGGPAGQMQYRFKIHSDIWQAFVNPDKRRKRFYNRLTGAVLHYIESEGSASEMEVRASPSNYAEIVPIEPEVQRGWMKEYLDSTDLGSGERSVLDALISPEYTSQMNATFTQALGERAQSWRDFRLSKIRGVVGEWERVNSVTRGMVTQHSSGKTFSAKTSGDTSDSRRRVINLLDLLTDEDISNIVLPIVLASIMVRAKK